MKAEQIKTGAAAQTAAPVAQERKREVSSILFPYGDLDDAVEIARAIHDVGGQSCHLEQLAGQLKVAASGGAFRGRLATPRIFGLTELERGVISLTPLGLRIVDASQEGAAKVEAFLAVPLYRKIYDKYKGYTLPPASALEREIATFGVSPKQTDKARQAFDRSARAAGFYWAGNERLTLPATKIKPETRPIENKTPDVERRNGAGGGGDDTGGLSLDPLLMALLRKIPATGQDWPKEQRVRWFRTFAMNVSQIYDMEDPVDLTIKAENSRQEPA